MPNQIIYALVARGAVVLSEHYPDDVHDRSVDATSVVLKKLSAAPERSGEDKQSFLYDGQSFHVLTVDAISFVCAADNALSRISAFQFLRELQKFWQQIYRDLGQTARAYQMNADFARVIQQQIETFQMRFDAQTPDRIAQVNEEISKTKEVMVQNIDKVLERGEKIELLVDKTERLDTAAVKFRRAAREVRSQACWQAWRTTVVTSVIVMVIAYGIAALSCGGLDIPNCR